MPEGYPKKLFVVHDILGEREYYVNMNPYRVLDPDNPDDQIVAVYEFKKFVKLVRHLEIEDVK